MTPKVQIETSTPEQLASWHPDFIAFMQAHGNRVPVPFVGYPFTQWMERMYRRFFRAMGYKFPDAPRGSLAYNLTVTIAQERGGFTQWLLDDSIKVDCPPDTHLIGCALIGEPYRFLRHREGLLCCPTCGQEWPFKYMVAQRG